MTEISNEQQSRPAASNENDEDPLDDIDQLIEDEQENYNEQISSSPSLLTSSLQPPPLEAIKRKYFDDSEEINEEDLIQLEQQINNPLTTQPTDSNESIAPAITCIECSALAHHVAYYKAFGIGVCNSCQKEFPSRYKLITKSSAKSEYFLSDSELANLKFMLKPNPSKGSWSSMKLFRLFEVMKIVREKLINKTNNLNLTDEEIIELLSEEKQTRELEKLNREIQKRKKIRREIIKEEFIQSYKPTNNNNSNKTNQKNKNSLNQHTHSFTDEKNGKKKCKECGFQLEYEEL